MIGPIKVIKKFLALSALLLSIASCNTAPVPLEKQNALDTAQIDLPDTVFPSRKAEAQIEPILKKDGFSWTDPRYSLGKHLVKGNELFWFDQNQNWHITRYSALLRPNKYSINRYMVNSARDVHKLGRTTTTSLATCIFARPAFTFRHYGDVSFPTFLADGLLMGTVDLFLSPVSYLSCSLLDSNKRSVQKVIKKNDRAAEDRLRREIQKGNPIPTYSTTPAWVE
ncbi:MAG: hypothetical protein M0Z37_05070 [Nitrospiraceae bacterium]|nr:hypothetical protein [Nitrospiraceae bacterium]